MDFIPASSPKHVPLSVEERVQLDLLRVLGKPGISLQIYDNIIDWACHYPNWYRKHTVCDETYRVTETCSEYIQSKWHLKRTGTLYVSNYNMSRNSYALA